MKTHESLKNTKIVFDERFAQKELAFFVRIANGVLIAIMVLFIHNSVVYPFAVKIANFCNYFN